MTSHAQAAQAIRKDLKAAFPSIKFSVRSESYSGGDAVRISYNDGVPSDQVDAIVGKYQYGHFDGMNDIYEYSNSIDSLPQVKYVQVQRDFSNERIEEVKQEIAKEYGIKNIDDDSEWMRIFNAWPSTTIYREMYKMTF